MRHLGYFFDFIGDENVVARYSDWIGDQAKGINENAHDADGTVLSVWCDKDSDRSQFDGRSDVQRSALDAMLLAMKVRLLASKWGKCGC